ncbi:MAG: PVC-type heme-binding CxxCH protein [Verrucomicrobiota bacterium]
MNIPAVLVCLALSLMTIHAADFPRVPPKEPGEALKSFRTLDGFRMELLAAEPLLADPVAMAYDENGRAYVAEMSDYPYTDKKNHKPSQENPTDQPIGKVRLLEDTNGDGRFDKATVFADGLSWPTGIAVWKGGVFVAATPDIWYFKDTNGDGRADIRRKLYTGFRKLNVQAVMNNFQWGLDHRIYGAGSSNGGEIRAVDKADAKALRLARNDFRFDAVTEEFEVISGGARFGNSFDDWGNRFLCNIRNPAQHVVLPHHYLARNPYLPVASAVHDVAEAGDQLPVYRTSPVEQWREFRARRWAADPTVTMPRSELVGAGVVTSSSGVTVYRGAAYPEKYRGQIFVADVAGNLFYRLKLAADGVTFTATRADEKVDFVTSEDIWFRPVNFINAPDGCLHVLDMYREVIEHPWSIPDDIHAQLDLESGRDRGRLYRLAPPAFKVPPQPRLGSATAAQLVAMLENPNSWWRETAHRLLFERQDPSAIEPLRRMLNQSANPLARLHALWSLAGLKALSEADVLRGLQDPAPGVREHAVRLAEPRLKQSPKLLDAVLRLAGDADQRVRFQVAFTLGEVSDPRATQALSVVARRDAADHWMRTAVLSSATESADELLQDALADRAFVSSAPAQELARQLAMVVGARAKPAEIQPVLNALAADDQFPRALQSSIVMGVADGLRRARKAITTVVDKSSPAAQLVGRLLAGAQQQARNASLPPVERVQAVQLLGYDTFDRVEPALKALLDPRQPQEIQLAAVRTLGGFVSERIAGILLEPWRSYTPAVRAEVAQAMLGRKERLLPLFDAVEDGRVLASQIPPSRRAVLLKHADPVIQQRAAKLFGQDAVTPRKEVIEKYRSALALKGDAKRGQQIYTTACLACHRMGDQGNDVGPNLATVRAWSVEQLLTNILDPNREVSPNYVEYLIELKDGQTVSGLIATETANSLTLKRADGAQETVLRQNIAQMSSSGLSLMPEGLEATVTPQQMADLIAFVLSAP